MKKFSRIKYNRQRYYGNGDGKDDQQRRKCFESQLKKRKS